MDIQCQRIYDARGWWASCSDEELGCPNALLSTDSSTPRPFISENLSESKKSVLLKGVVRGIVNLSPVEWKGV